MKDCFHEFLQSKAVQSANRRGWSKIRVAGLQRANQLAQELTGGEVTVECEGVFQLVRRGYARPIELPMLTEATIRDALRGWDMWDDD
jgi:hypothetical protein